MTYIKKWLVRLNIMLAETTAYGLCVLYGVCYILYIGSCRRGSNFGHSCMYNKIKHQRLCIHANMKRYMKLTFARTHTEYIIYLIYFAFVFVVKYIDVIGKRKR